MNHRTSRCRARVLACACAVGLALGMPSSGWAQAGWQILPGNAHLPQPLAAPREPVLGGKLLATDGPTRFGAIIEGEALLGGSVPLLRVGRMDDLTHFYVGLQGGAFARFNMETRAMDLIASDWVFAVPLVLRRGAHWARFRYRHQSAHLGDEYAEQFDVDRIPYNRDVFDLTAFGRVASLLGVYVGGSGAVFAQPSGSGRWVAWAGFELEATSSRRPVRPYLAVDARFDQDTEWDPGVNVQAGLHLWPDDTTRPGIRIVGELFVGPSPVGQFSRLRTTSLALGGIITR